MKTDPEEEPVDSVHDHAGRSTTSRCRGQPDQCLHERDDEPNGRRQSGARCRRPQTNARDRHLPSGCDARPRPSLPAEVERSHGTDGVAGKPRPLPSRSARTDHVLPRALPIRRAQPPRRPTPESTAGTARRRSACCLPATARHSWPSSGCDFRARSRRPAAGRKRAMPATQRYMVVVKSNGLLASRRLVTYNSCGAGSGPVNPGGSTGVVRGLATSTNRDRRQAGMRR